MNNANRHFLTAYFDSVVQSKIIEIIKNNSTSGFIHNIEEWQSNLPLLNIIWYILVIFHRCLPENIWPEMHLENLYIHIYVPHMNCTREHNFCKFMVTVQILIMKPAEPDPHCYSYIWWIHKWAVTHDFQQCGILTSVDSDEPAQPPFKLRNSKWCSINSLTFIGYSSDKQWLWSDCAYAQADLRLCWSHIPHCWRSNVAAQLIIIKLHHWNGWTTQKFQKRTISNESTVKFYKSKPTFFKLQ